MLFSVARLSWSPSSNADISRITKVKLQIPLYFVFENCLTTQLPHNHVVHYNKKYSSLSVPPVLYTQVFYHHHHVFY